jgi:hypothetical protein
MHAQRPHTANAPIHAAFCVQLVGGSADTMPPRTAIATVNSPSSISEFKRVIITQQHD